MQKDYPELEGKIIDHNFPSLEGKLKVVGLNYDIGVTLVSADDPDVRVVCGNGPASPQIRGWPCFSENNYRTVFYAIVRMIKKGKYNRSMIARIAETLGTILSSKDVLPQDSCSWS